MRRYFFIRGKGRNGVLQVVHGKKFLRCTRTTIKGLILKNFKIYIRKIRIQNMSYYLPS